jgi:cytochrome b involved in lipid metabolism
MKRTVAVALFISWAIVVAILVAGMMSWQKQTAPTGPSNVQTQTPNTPSIALTMDELAKHNNASSCWLLINGKIYDVTSFITAHPGGDTSILNTCGTDATQAYDTKGSRGRPHSSTANDMLQQYYLGDLGQTVQ